MNQLSVTTRHTLISFTSISSKPISFSSSENIKTTMLSHEQTKHQTLIFSYGTLKRGFANHPLLNSLISQNNAVFIGTYTTELHFPLVQGPYGVPFLLNFPGEGQHRVRGELYSVSEHGLEKLDELEGITLGHYERLPVKVVADENGTVVEAMAYYGHRSFAEDMWRKCGYVGFGEYTHELEKGYVKKDMRPEGTRLRDHIRLFCSGLSE